MDTLYLHLVLMSLFPVHSDVLLYFALKYVSGNDFIRLYMYGVVCIVRGVHAALHAFMVPWNKGLENWFILLQLMTLDDDTPDRVAVFDHLAHNLTEWFIIP